MVLDSRKPRAPGLKSFFLCSGYWCAFSAHTLGASFYSFRHGSVLLISRHGSVYFVPECGLRFKASVVGGSCYLGH